MRSWVLALGLVLAGSLWGHAFAAPLSVEQSSWSQADAIRQQELLKHTAWQWSMKVVSNSPVGTFHLVSMQGPVEGVMIHSLGLFDDKGQPVWLAMEKPTSGSLPQWQFSQGGEKWRDDANSVSRNKALQELLGREVSVEQLNAWVNGLTQGATNTVFSKDELGVHPQQAEFPGAQVNWTQWFEVSTEDKQTLLIPRRWSLKMQKREFDVELEEIAAYRPHELPNRNWPFQDKPKNPFPEEAPIVQDKDLDYQSW